MTERFEFEARLRLALREAAERGERRTWPTRALVATPSLVGRLAAAAAVVAVIAFGVILTVGQHQRARPVSPPKVIAHLQLADSGGSAVAGFGSVWVEDASRHQLLRVDPHTRQVTARLAVSGNLSATPGDGALWVLQAGGPFAYDYRGPLLRVDPQTNRVVARIPLRTPAGQPFVAAGGGVIADGHAVWVWGQFGALRVDTRSNRVTNTIRLPRGVAAPQDLAAWDGELWTLTADDRLLSFNRRTGALLSQTRVRLPQPDGFRVAGDAFLATSGGVVARLDPSTGGVLWRTPVGQKVDALTEVRGLIWVATTSTPRDRLSAIDPDNGRVITSTRLSDFGATAIVATGEDLWLATLDGKVTVLRPSSTRPG
jgi:outer membrane protein assembly factor BamB